MAKVKFFVIITISILIPSSIWAEKCHNKDITSKLLCLSSRALRSYLTSIENSNASITIIPGFEIVNSEKSGNLNEFDGRSNDIDDDSTVIGRIANYLRKHEVNIKLSQFLDKNQVLNVLKNVETAKDMTEGRKKDKGYGLVLAVGLMMGKVMAALGISGIGAIAMKALGVSLMALLFTAIIGLKSLSEKNNESSHHVQYVSSHDGHHRRRRGINSFTPLPYRGWAHIQKTNAKLNMKHN